MQDIALSYLLEINAELIAQGVDVSDFTPELLEEIVNNPTEHLQSMREKFEQLMALSYDEETKKVYRLIHTQGKIDGVLELIQFKLTVEANASAKH